ncbi:MAG: hemolysin III family protein [Anaerolineales bacterium]|jgi:hemolysin III
MFLNLREPINGLTHLLAAAASLVGSVVLIVLGWSHPAQLVGAAVFGSSLTILFLASGLYHSVRGSQTTILRLRMFDHAAIYLLIAGTYTPICLWYLSGGWRWGLLGIVWAMALTGIVTKVFLLDTPRGLTTGIYLAMGWMAVIALGPLLRSMPPGVMLWMAIGGAFYTLGAMGYIFKRPILKPGVFGFHEVWHIFVILAGASHYIGMALALVDSTGL